MQKLTPLTVRNSSSPPMILSVDPLINLTPPLFTGSLYPSGDFPDRAAKELMCFMVTEKSPRVGDNLRWLCGRLLVVWIAGILLSNAALAQPRTADKKKDKDKVEAGTEAGPLDQVDRPAAKKSDKKPDDNAEPVEADEPAAEPEKKFKELPIDETLKRNANAISGMLMAGKFEGDQQKQTFDDYYQKYFLPRWTHAKHLGNLPGYRKELRVSNFGKKSANAIVHDHLTALVLDFMKELATGPYHPAAQVNAMLMIGELNSVEQPTPVPLPEAMNVMIGAVDDPKTPDAIRAAAMVGIQRHLASGLPAAEVRKTLTTDLLKLASSDLPEGPETQGRDWILGQAIEILGALGSAGENGAIAKQMLKAVADSKLSFSTRTIAAESLGNLSYAGAGINPVEATAVLGQFAIDACTEELRLVKEHEYPVSRRRMKQRLGAVLKALNGTGEESRMGFVSLAKEEAPKAFLGDLQKEIEGMLKSFDDPNREGDDMEEPVSEFKDQLEAWLKQKPK